MEINEEVKIRKILVKCPPLLADAFSLFPFLMALKEAYPKAEINILCEENSSVAFNFLPYRVRCFERPKEKKGLIKTHHFCANLNDVFNIDLFFDLENSFNSSFIGFNLCSKERIGFGSGWNKYFYTQKISQMESLTLEEKGLELLQFFTKNSFLDLNIYSERNEMKKIDKIEQLFNEPVPPKFVMIMLDSFKNVSSEIKKWTQFFDNFHGQKFVIWSLQDNDMISELFASVDLGHNNLYMHRGVDSNELLYLLDRVIGVVTNNVWSEGLVTYFGVNSVSLLNSTHKSLPTYKKFKFKPQRFIFFDTGVIKYKYRDEEKDYSEMNQIVDHIHFQFKL